MNIRVDMSFFPDHLMSIVTNSVEMRPFYVNDYHSSDQGGNAKFSVFEFSGSMKEFEDLLSDQYFLRIHHSYLINLKHVLKYIKCEGGSVLMSNNVELEVSRRKKAAFMEMLSAYIGK